MAVRLLRGERARLALGTAHRRARGGRAGHLPRGRLHPRAARGTTRAGRRASRRL